MPEFRKYMHIQRLGTSETEGILNGTVYIFPKLDGANASVWYDDGIVCASRNRILTGTDGLRGFKQYIKTHIDILQFFDRYKDKYQLYGEWLVKHTYEYKDDAWNKFYVFDVYDRKEDRYLEYDEYIKLLEPYGTINIIPVLSIIDNPSLKKINKYLEYNKYLVKNGTGEGIVLKNYDFINRYGRYMYAKVVKSRPIKEIKKEDNEGIEYNVVNMFLTDHDIDKEMAKISMERALNENSYIKELMGRVFHSFIEDYTFQIIRKYKSPTIDFRKLRYYINNKVRSYIFEARTKEHK